MKRFFSLFVTLCMIIVFANAQATSKKHVVERGETLSTIAKKYGVEEAKIIELNPNAKQFIYVGMELTIPEKKVQPTTPKQPSNPVNTTKSKQTTITTKENIVPLNVYRRTYSSYSSEKKGLDTPLLTFGNNDQSSCSMYLTLEGNFGMSNFNCTEASSNSTMAYGGELQWQLYLQGNTMGGYYAQAGIGFRSLGAAKYNLNYLQARVLPLGYAVPINDDMNFVVKVGGYVGIGINDLETIRNSYSTSFDFGIDGGIAIDYKMFTLGATLQYGLAEVAPDSPATLRNMGIWGTLSYKFGKF